MLALSTATPLKEARVPPDFRVLEELPEPVGLPQSSTHPPCPRLMFPRVPSRGPAQEIERQSERAAARPCGLLA